MAAMSNVSSVTAPAEETAEGPVLIAKLAVCYNIQTKELRIV